MSTEQRVASPQIARMSTTGALVAGRPTTAWDEDVGGEQASYNMIDPAQAMAELNELLRIRAKLKRRQK